MNSLDLENAAFVLDVPPQQLRALARRDAIPFIGARNHPQFSWQQLEVAMMQCDKNSDL